MDRVWQLLERFVSPETYINWVEVLAVLAFVGFLLFIAHSLSLFKKGSS